MSGDRKMDAPEPYATIIDATCADDREWFEEHPQEEMRERPYVPGELWPVPYEPKDISHIEVYKVAEGVRLRQPIVWLREKREN